MRSGALFGDAVAPPAGKLRDAPLHEWPGSLLPCCLADAGGHSGGPSSPEVET